MPQKKKKFKKIKTISHLGEREVIVKPKASKPKPRKKTPPKIKWKSAGAASYNRKKK